MRCIWSVLLLSLIAVGGIHAQTSPFMVPQPQGGPIVGPDGKLLSGLDKVQSPWSGSFEIGFNGSDGNTELLKLRVGADVKYDTPEDVFMFNMWYGFATQDSKQIENKALVTARNEMPFEDVLAWFTQAQYEFDDFRDVKRRAAIHSGLSYTAIKSEESLLKLRTGFGASYEWGGPKDRQWIPEGQFGGDFEQRLTERIKLTATADYYPDLADWSRYRIRGRAAIEFLIDPSLNMALRLGVQDRYDSQPGDAKRNDLDYFATLLFRF